MDAAAEARAQLAGLAPASPKSTMAGQAKALPLTPGAAAAAHVRESGVTIREKFAFSAETKAAAPMGINPGSADSPVIAATTDVDTRIVEGYRRPLMIADLFGSETISGNALTYYVESPTVEGGPSTVAEKGLKPLTSFGDPTPVTVALQKSTTRRCASPRTTTASTLREDPSTASTATAPWPSSHRCGGFAPS